MRNFLTGLTLCFFMLTVSNVFAAKYDDSKRSERLGLSFYDGRPLYIIRFGCDVVDRSLTRADLIRVRTGSNLTDYGIPNGSGVIVDYVRNDAGKMYEYGYSFYGVDENGDLIPLHSATLSYPYYQEMLDLLSMRLSPDDVAVNIFDAISERSKSWLLPALGVALALFGVRYCYRLLVRMVQGESGVGLGGATDLSVTASRGDDSFSNDYSGAVSVATLVNAWENADVSNADEYATGEAFGREFTPKAVASNVDLQNEWSRLSESERAELLGDDFGAPFGGRAYPGRQGNYYVDLERDNYYVDLTNEDER